MTMEKVSVIIPCYNVEKYVEECLDSVINQTICIDNMEIIMVDDCSEDGTMEILQRYEQQYPDQILLVKSEKNARQGAARNIGLQYVSGDYISFVDADDYISRDMYEILVNVIRKTGSDIVEFRKFSVELPEKGNQDNYSYEVFDIVGERARKQLLLSNDVMGESCTRKLYRHTFLQKASVRFAEGMGYEEPLFTYPLKFGVNRIARVEGEFYFYRTNEEGTTLNYMSNPSTILDHLNVQWQLLDYIRKFPDLDIYREETEMHFIHAFFVEPFYFLSLRGMIMSVDLYRYMCRIVKMVLPDYKDNIYVQYHFFEEEAHIIDLIAKSDTMDDEEAATRLEQVCREIRGL